MNSIYIPRSKDRFCQSGTGLVVSPVQKNPPFFANRNFSTKTHTTSLYYFIILVNSCQLFIKAGKQNTIRLRFTRFTHKTARIFLCRNFSTTYCIRATCNHIRELPGAPIIEDKAVFVGKAAKSTTPVDTRIDLRSGIALCILRTYLIPIRFDCPPYAPKHSGTTGTLHPLVRHVFSGSTRKVGGSCKQEVLSLRKKAIP